MREVTSCSLYTANYPLLIEHIIREAELYRRIITMLEDRQCVFRENVVETELFWNQIMMEHALFIRGLLDPTEGELIETAAAFAEDYSRLPGRGEAAGLQGHACADKKSAGNHRTLSRF